MPQLNILFEDKRWRKIPRLKSRLEKAATVTVGYLPKKLIFPFAVTLLLTSDKQIRKLNRDFRAKDKATNVLSFPQFEPRQLTKIGKQRTPVELGDIIIAYQYVVAESKKTHKVLINHLIHLFVHGLLHLFGYDHGTDAEANGMERLEKRIMAELGLPNPYSGEAETAASQTKRAK